MWQKQRDRGGVLLPESRACFLGSAGRTTETTIWKVVPEAVFKSTLLEPGDSDLPCQLCLGLKTHSLTWAGFFLPKGLP